MTKTEWEGKRGSEFPHSVAPAKAGVPLICSRGGAETRREKQWDSRFRGNDEIIDYLAPLPVSALRLDPDTVRTDAAKSVVERCIRITLSSPSPPRKRGSRFPSGVSKGSGIPAFAGMTRLVVMG